MRMRGGDAASLSLRDSHSFTMYIKSGKIVCRFVLTFLLCLVAVMSESATKEITRKKADTKETNVFTFIGLVVLRMIYGFAAIFGAQEGFSEFMNGIFVPPGAEDDSDYYRDYLDENGEESDFDYRNFKIG